MFLLCNICRGILSLQSYWLCWDFSSGNIPLLPLPPPLRPMPIPLIRTIIRNNNNTIRNPMPTFHGYSQPSRLSFIITITIRLPLKKHICSRVCVGSSNAHPKASRQNQPTNICLITRLNGKYNHSRFF